jgi:2-haloalkanoic acid dehalogenase type II
MKIKVISFDIFQTLVDVNQRIPQIWKGILGENYTKEEGQRGVNAILENYPHSLHKALHADRFYTMREVYLDCALTVLDKIKLSVSPEVIVDNLMMQHAKAPFYNDVKECLAKLQNRYRIILSSDSNHTMVNDLLKQLTYEELFISDELSSYKGSPDGSFFWQVIRRIGVKPDEILHIGDSGSDIIGAKCAGVISCWINRDKSVWTNEIRPDYTIESLSELTKVLQL